MQVSEEQKSEAFTFLSAILDDGRRKGFELHPTMKDMDAMYQELVNLKLLNMVGPDIQITDLGTYFMSAFSSNLYDIYLANIQCGSIHGNEVGPEEFVKLIREFCTIGLEHILGNELIPVDILLAEHYVTSLGLNMFDHYYKVAQELSAIQLN